MKKDPTQLTKFLVIFCLGLAWASLFYNNYIQQQIQINTTLPLLQSTANQLARSVDESLSLKLDYNRDSMRDVYLEEALITVIQPVQILKTGHAWLIADEKIRWGTENNQTLPLKSITAPVFLTEVQSHTAGASLFSWQKDEQQQLNAWAPISIQGYDWMVGVSLPFDEFKNINEIWHFSKREIRNSITGDMTAHLKIPSLTIPSAKDKMK